MIHTVPKIPKRQRRPRRRFTDAQLLTLYKRHRHDIPAVARGLGVSLPTVYKWLTRLAVQLPRQSQSLAIRTALGPNPTPQELHNVAKVFGVSEATCRYHRDRHPSNHDTTKTKENNHE